MFYEPFHLGPLRIAPYGIMVALGLLAAIVLGGRENQRIRLMTPELFEKVALWTVLWGLICSRMFYVFTDLPRFMAKPSSILAIWEGGLVFYGGPIGSVLYLTYHFVIRRSSPIEGPELVGGPKVMRQGITAALVGAGVLVVAISAGLAAGAQALVKTLIRVVISGAGGGIAGFAYAPREHLRVATFKQGWQRMLRFFDLGAPMLALAHAFGRIGCLCAGCCYGAAHEGSLALHYPEGSPAWIVGGLGRYPIPLVESGIEAMLCLWLMNLRLKKKFHGQVMLHYVMIYPAARFVLEMFRGDAVRGYVARLSTPGLNEALGLDPSVPVMLTTSQFISILVVAASIVLIFIGKRASANGPIPEVPWVDPTPAAGATAEVAEEAEDEEDEDEDEDEDDDTTEPGKKDGP